MKKRLQVKKPTVMNILGITPATQKAVRESRVHFSRRYMLHVCKDGTVSYRDTSTREPVFNGVALPVFSVDTEEQAQQLQVRFCRLQYTAHPDLPGRPWYRLSVLGDGTDPVSRPDPVLEVQDLDGITTMFAKYWSEHLHP